MKALVLTVRAHAPAALASTIAADPSVERTADGFAYANADTEVRFSIQTLDDDRFGFVIPLPRPAVVGQEAAAVMARWGAATPLHVILGENEQRLDTAWLLDEWSSMSKANIPSWRLPRDQKPYAVPRATLAAAWEWNATAPAREAESGVDVLRVRYLQDRGIVQTHVVWAGDAAAIVPLVDAITIGTAPPVRVADLASGLAAPNTAGTPLPYVRLDAPPSVITAPPVGGERVELDDLLEDDLRLTETSSDLAKGRLKTLGRIGIALGVVAAVIMGIVTYFGGTNPITGEQHRVLDSDRAPLERVVRGGAPMLTHPRLGFAIPDPGPSFRAMPSASHRRDDVAAWTYEAPTGERLVVYVDWSSATWGPFSIVTACDDLTNMFGAALTKIESFEGRGTTWACAYERPAGNQPAIIVSLHGWNIERDSYALIVADIAPSEPTARRSVFEARVR